MSLLLKAHRQSSPTSTITSEGEMSGEALRSLMYNQVKPPLRTGVAFPPELVPKKPKQRHLHLGFQASALQRAEHDTIIHATYGYPKAAEPTYGSSCMHMNFIYTHLISSISCEYYDCPKASVIVFIVLFPETYLACPVCFLQRVMIPASVPRSYCFSICLSIYICICI